MKHKLAWFVGNVMLGAILYVIGLSIYDTGYAQGFDTGYRFGSFFGRG